VLLGAVLTLDIVSLLNNFIVSLKPLNHIFSFAEFSWNI